MSITKRPARKLALTVLSLVSALSFSSEVAAALFDSGIPAGWTSEGGTSSTGTSGIDGVVGLWPDPSAGTRYGWISTNGGVFGVGLDLVNNQNQNGSTLTSPSFAAVAGDNLHFAFNFVTSDGFSADLGEFADYAWAELIDGTSSSVLLFTARTTAVGSTVPGDGLPPIEAVITPPNVNIVNPDAPAGPVWSPLGVVSSGLCFNEGCGFTGWVESNYTIAATGNYFLKFGVVNWIDTAFDTGLAFDGITVAGEPIGAAVPEPAALALLGIGLAGLVATRRRKQDA